jgi:hypothetical protein
MDSTNTVKIELWAVGGTSVSKTITASTPETPGRFQVGCFFCGSSIFVTGIPIIFTLFLARVSIYGGGSGSAG